MFWREGNCLKQLLDKSLKHHAGTVVFLCLFTCVFSVFQPLSVRVLSFLLGTVGDGRGIGLPIALLLGYVAMFSFTNLSNAWMDYSSRKLYKQTACEIKAHLSKRLMHSSFTVFEKHKRGDIINAYGLIDDAVLESIYPRIQMLYLSVLLIAVSLSLITISVSLFAVVGALFVIWLGLTRRISRAIECAVAKELETQKQLNSYLSDMLSGASDIFANSMLARAEHVLKEQVDSASAAQGSAEFLKSAKVQADYLTVSIMAGISLIVAALLPDVASTDLLAVFFYINILYIPITSLGIVHINYAGLKAKYKLIDDILLIEQEAPAQGLSAFTSLAVAELSIGFEGRTVVDGLSFSIEKGSITRISGKSGAGKSSVLNALLGFIPFQVGDIRWNGEVIEEAALLSLRDQVSLFSQEPYTFSASLEDNIACSLPKEPQRILSACRAAALVPADASDLSSLPAYIMENGSNLSVGQAHRVCLARVLYHARPICFFDEPTASLDDANGEVVRKAILAISKNSAVLLTTHDRRFDSIASRSINVAANAEERGGRT